MICPFHVGQKVVCVEDEWPGFVDCPLVKGAIYTVDEIIAPELTWSFDGIDVRPSIRLVETRNNVAEIDSFNPARFRPLVETKTDISVFQAMLTDQKQAVPA
jgi:hypothetical protein